MNAITEARVNLRDSEEMLLGEIERIKQDQITLQMRLNRCEGRLQGIRDGLSALRKVEKALEEEEAERKAQEELTGNYVVAIGAAGDKKIQVIKEVRSLTSLGLKEAKDLVDKASIDTPSIILTEVSEALADRAKATLERAGALVLIITSDA